MIKPPMFLARAFINAFGITQPTPKQEIQAAWFVTGLLVLAVGGVVAVTAAAFLVLHK